MEVNQVIMLRPTQSPIVFIQQLGHMSASGKTKEFVILGTDKTAVEIEWILDRPVREDIYEYIVNG